MERPWKPAAFRFNICTIRAPATFLSFSVKMNNFRPTDPGCWMTAAHRSRKVKRDAFQIVKFVVENQFKSCLLIGTRSNGTKDAIILSLFSFFPSSPLIPTVFVQTNWRESFRIIILARVIWSEKLSDKRSKRVAYR